MSNTTWMGIGLAAVAACGLGIGCGGDDDDSSPAQSGGTGTGATASGGTAAGGSGAAATGGGTAAGGSGAAATGGASAAPVLTTNMPGATFTESTVNEAGGLVLVSSNFVEDESLDMSGEYYKAWYAVVRNTGSNTICHAQATATFMDAAGTTEIEMYGFADAAAYNDSIGLTIPCIAPGEEGVVYDNDISADVDQAGVVAVDVTLDGHIYPTAVPHASAPQVVSATVVDAYGSGTYWRLTGDVQAVATIYNIGMDAYPVIGGMVVDQLIDTNLGTLTPGATWTYETTSHEGSSFSEFYQYVDFIEGAATRVIGQVNLAASDRETERRRLLQERRDLAERWRPTEAAAPAD